MSCKWRKKPLVIEAFQWTGGPDQKDDPVWAIDAIRQGIIEIYYKGTPDVSLVIHTLEGTMIAKPGDYIIREVKGEIYPCKSDIFLATYEEVIDG